VAKHPCRAQQIFTVECTEDNIAIHLLQTARKDAGARLSALNLIAR
jgi:hypothetical protein